MNEWRNTETHIVNEHFKDFPLFMRIVERMQNEEDSLMLRSQLQYDIMAMSQMNQVFSRTRREVTTDLVSSRETATYRVDRISQRRKR